ncbi:hypothetical protein C0995_006337 [Termitomyces sp. Mi166|nr:hypothetical protein C0995_006337 [Termitomyces sp. Mi166\
MASPIRQLLKLITESVDKLEAACDASGHQVPALHAPFSPQSEAFRASPDAAEAVKVICAAALQMEATLAPPEHSFYHLAAGFAKSAALRICLELNITEILREAGPEGAHVDAIALKTRQDPKKLARFLRYLATHHVYREIAPDVFTNNRISTVADTLKSSQEIIDKLDDSFKGAAFAWETLADPETVRSGDPKTAPFSRAFGSGKTLWDLHAHDEYRARRFNFAMKGVQSLQPKNAILEAYDWDQLPETSTIIDVGGGVGSESFPLAQKFPKFNIVIQDLALVIAHAKKVIFHIHNFFEPQTTSRNVSVFLLKQILHDWSDEYCVKILTHLRAAAGDDTRLLLIESLIPYACHDPGSEAGHAIAGSVFQEAPRPLLANYGAVNGLPYHLDFNLVWQMFSLFNSQERTGRHIEELLSSVGWSVKRFWRHRSQTAFLQSIEAVPL